MLEKLKKHSVKIFVFTINILLAAIAVLIIREKDQARLLENAQKEIPANGTSQNNPSLPSFESSVSTESADSNSMPADASTQSCPVDDGTAAPAASLPATPAPVPSPEITVPSTSVPAPAPAPTPTAKPSNAKTKTS
jgi:hypothetical protein